LTGRDLPAEAAEQSANGVVAVTETLSDLLHGLFLDQNGAEDFVLALRWFGGLQEEGTQSRGIHAAGSVWGIFRDEWSQTLPQAVAVEQRRFRPGAVQTLPNKGLVSRWNQPAAKSARSLK
jgi:hypothetical protein